MYPRGASGAGMAEVTNHVNDAAATLKITHLLDRFPKA